MIYVEEGGSYTVGVTITNTSTKAGAPCGATLGLRVRASGDGVTLIPTTDKSVSLAAGGSRSFSYGMSIPMGLGGGTGVIDAVVSHGYAILASDTEPLTIAAAPPTVEYVVGEEVVWTRYKGTSYEAEPEIVTIVDITYPEWSDTAVILFERANGERWQVSGSGLDELSKPEPEPVPPPPPPEVYTCPYCGATFASEAELDIHKSEVHAEELLYDNWLRTGGTGSIEYWRSIGSPLYYTPPPPPECTPGDRKCVDEDLWGCNAEGKWVLIERNSPDCRAAPPPEPVKKHHYRVTYLDGRTRIISWEPDPVTKPNLWDFVDRDELLSWEYLGYY